MFDTVKDEHKNSLGALSKTKKLQSNQFNCPKKRIHTQKERGKSNELPHLFQTYKAFCD